MLEKMLEQTLKCKKCGKNYPTTDLRFFGDAKTLMCKQCIEDKQRSLVKEQLEEKQIKETRRKYKCSKCKYTFKAGLSHDRGCPYCGSKQVVAQDVTNDVDNLILESSSKKYDL